MARIPTVLVLGTVALCSSLAAQDAAYLAEVPTAQQVAQGLAVASPRETAARRYAALFALGNLMESMIGVRTPAAAEQQRLTDFRSMREAVYQGEKQRDPVNYLLERCSQAYSESPAFQRELLDLYFTPAWQASYGARLDPRRWKPALALPPGTKVTAVSMKPSMVEECGSATAPAVAAAATQATNTTVTAKPAERQVGPLAAEGNAYLKAGDTTRALAAFKASVAKDPSEPLGYTGLGRIYNARRQYSLSVEAWQKAAALVPGDWSVAWSLGVAYYGANHYAAARDAELKSLRLKPPPEFIGYVYEFLGATYIQLAQRDSAIAVYHALVPIDSARATALAARISAADRAVAGSLSPPADARPLTAAQKAEVEALRTEGKKYYEAKQYEKARASYEKLLRISPDDGWGLYELGTSMLMIEGDADTDSLIAVWKRAVALEPTDTELLLSLGDALYTWDPSVAYAALQRVIDLKPDAATQARAHSVMGWSHYFFLDSRSAEAEFKEAMRLDPANDNYLYALGTNYAKAGAKDAAMGVFRQLTTRNQRMAQELLAEINKK